MSVVADLEQSRVTAPSSAPQKPMWLIFLVLPSIFLLGQSAFVHVAGPYYLGSKVDPDYAYLCNSLNIAVGQAPNHVDHPGTTLQFLGAVVITVAHPFAGKAEKIDAVLRRPEAHLHWINRVLGGGTQFVWYWWGSRCGAAAANGDRHCCCKLRLFSWRIVCTS